MSEVGTHPRTLWEAGRRPGRELVALGVAVVLSAAVLEVLLRGQVGWLFDLCFVALSVGVALAVRPADFFTIGVLPPLLMLGLFWLLGVTDPDVIARAGDSAVQAVVSGLSHHSAGLVVGYLLCLGVLALRQRVLVGR